MGRNIKQIKMRTYFLLFAAVIALISCGPSYTEPVQASEVGFAVSLFKNVNAVASKGENVIVSPYSAAIALSMLAEGAQGQTRAEFDNVLGGVLYKAENLGSNDNVIVKSANSVWIDDNFSPRNRYVSLLEKDFDAFLDVLNFADPATLKAINNWCAENTNGKITEILDRLDPSNVMVLVNALYFNVPWENPFDPSLTSEQVFHGLSGEPTVRMMCMTGMYNYAESGGFQVIQLPYSGLEYAMYVILPPKGADVDKLLAKSDAGMLLSAFEMLQQQQVRFFMPSFKIETSMLLNRSLQNMGIRTAFTSAADFGGIAEMGPLVLDQVKQKCYVGVSEKGTEAAAVTAAQIRLTSARPVLKVPVMRVDRPFFFVIADNENRKVLFAGKIVNM